MQLKPNLQLRKIGNEHLVMEESELGVDYSKVISLNESAAFLINSTLNKDFNKQEWINLLLQRYDVSVDQATLDVEKLIESLKKEKLIFD